MLTTKVQYITVKVKSFKVILDYEHLARLHVNNVCLFCVYSACREQSRQTVTFL